MTSLPTLRRKILRSFWGMILLYGLLGFFLVVSVQLASGTSPRMIHLNYDSIAAAAQMRDAAAALRDPGSYHEGGGARARAQFEAALVTEEGNITEPGEKQIAVSLRALWEQVKRQPLSPGQPAIDLAEFTRLNDLLRSLVAVNETGMFRLAQDNESLSRRVMIGAIIFFLVSLLASLILADGLARRIATPLKSIAETLHRRPAVGRRLKLIEPDTLELLILTTELTRLWERVTETDKVNVQEIIQQKSKLESVLESVEDGLLVMDLKSTVSHANQCLAELIGLKAEEIRGKPWRDLPAVGPNYLKLRSILSAEMQDSAEVDLVLRGVSRQYAARSREIVSLQSGQGGQEAPVGMLFLLHDITEKRQRDRFRSDFIDLLSHEIKTPLQSLGTATELLGANRADLPETVRPLVETISEDVERIKAVANEFVQVTQSHAKVLRLKLDKTALNQSIPEWIKPFHVVAKDRRIQLSFLQEGSQTIWANLDRVKFPWVLSNLLSNAVRFAPVNSEVGVLLTDRNGFVEIQVRDEGPGISEEDQARMFEPFFQSTLPTSSGQKGLFGIGLTIAREVVEAHDGRIEYYLRQPQGSEFRILLPFPQS